MCMYEVKSMTKPELMKEDPPRPLWVPSRTLSPPVLEATPRAWLLSWRHRQDPQGGS